jgi:hypothetical protein
MGYRPTYNWGGTPKYTSFLSKAKELQIEFVVKGAMVVYRFLMFFLRGQSEIRIEFPNCMVVAVYSTRCSLLSGY